MIIGFAVVALAAGAIAQMGKMTGLMTAGTLILTQGNSDLEYKELRDKNQAIAYECLERKNQVGQDCAIMERCNYKSHDSNQTA